MGWEEDRMGVARSSGEAASRAEAGQVQGRPAGPGTAALAGAHPGHAARRQAPRQACGARGRGPSPPCCRYVAAVPRVRRCRRVRPVKKSGSSSLRGQAGVGWGGVGKRSMVAQPAAARPHSTTAAAPARQAARAPSQAHQPSMSGSPPTRSTRSSRSPGGGRRSARQGSASASSSRSSCGRPCWVGAGRKVGPRAGRLAEAGPQAAVVTGGGV